MPADWRDVFGGRAGRARFTRRFGRPTNLGPDEQVLLVFEDVGGRSTIELNGDRLGEIQAGQARVAFDVTDRLQDNNRLTVEMVFAPAAVPRTAGGCWQEVALEIRSSE